MIPFEQASYLSQVKRLKTLAVEALKYYPIKVSGIHFIKHGANAIFRVTDTKNKKYLLRIHPVGYHTKQAILEEIKWLNYILKTTNLSVPNPFNTIDSKYLIECSHETMSNSRFCDMFEWIPGRFRWKSINSQYSYTLGTVIAQLQKNGQKVNIKNRHYWSAEGLVGTNGTKFKNVEKLTEVSAKEQKIITAARRFTFQRLKEYEEAYPNRSGLIHADLHPNNFMMQNNNCAVIDFDDCGVGLYGYDLAVALFAFEYLTEGEKRKDFAKLKQHLFEGYAEYMPFTQQDFNLSPCFLLARKLTVIGWLELRKENPRLKSFFHKEVTRAIKYFENIRSKI